jgi:hypothetical protein
MFLHYVVSTALDLESTLPVNISASLLSIQRLRREPLKICLNRELRCLLIMFRKAELHRRPDSRRVFVDLRHTIAHSTTVSHRTYNTLVNYACERATYPFHAGASVFGDV